MRPGTKIKNYHSAYIFNAGGMGDFVNYSASTYWLAQNCPWFTAVIYVPRYLVPLFKDIHECNPSWKVLPSEDFSKTIVNGTPLVGPDVIIEGINRSPQLLTCLGAHPFDVGFAYYAGSTPPPADAYLPVLDYPIKTLRDSGILSILPMPYAVICTGNVHDARMPTGKHLNPIIRHCKSRGLTPVFLGKADRLGDGRLPTRFPDDIHYHEGLDLRDKTTVKEAACIMQHAAVTVGLDCGLLHLAALMKDSKIVFGYNITTVEHRKPIRRHGKTVNVSLDESDLACVGCQSKLKRMTHQFDKCFYGDNLCIDKLFENESERFTQAIDELTV